MNTARKARKVIEPWKLREPRNDRSAETRSDFALERSAVGDRFGL